MKANTPFNPRVYKLPAVKDCLYHPHLPTFRRMDIDTAAHKLPDEHCRTTAKCGAEYFKNAAITLYQPPEKPLSGTTVTETGRSLIGYEDKSDVGADEMLHSKKDWNAYSAKKKDKTMQLPYPGYSMRFYSPAVTGSWKYCLRPEPFIDGHGQRPVPANIFDRYRNLSSSYGASTAAWKP